jgi:hypothetical protein
MVIYTDLITTKALSIDAKVDNGGIMSLPPVSTGTISGTVFMPKGEFAPKGGIRVPVFASTIEAGGKSVKTVVTIPEGSSSVRYSLVVNTNYRYRVWYDLNEGTTYGYDQWGVYTSDGMKEYIKLGLLLDVKGDIGNINLTLYYKK